MAIDISTLSCWRLRVIGWRNIECDRVKGDAYEIVLLVPRPVDFVFLANAFHGVSDGPRLA